MLKTKGTVMIRKINSYTSVLAIRGEVNAFAENAVMEAYTQATTSGAQTILLDFSGMEYMNSAGIGLLAALLIRCNHQQQRLLACNLPEHYQLIFEITRLNEVIRIFPTEAEAVKSLDMTLRELSAVSS